MALNLYGDASQNIFEQDANVDINGTQTAFACLWRGKLTASQATAADDLMNLGGNFVSKVSVTITEDITSLVRTSDRNVLDILVSPYTADQEYTIFSVWDGSSVYHYVDGVLAGVGGATTGTLLTVSSKLLLKGLTTDNEDVAVTEAAIWVDSFPSTSDIQSYPSTALGDFATPPTHSYKPTGGGEIVSTITDFSGSNGMTQISGSTTTPNAPTADGGTAPSGGVTITELNGKAINDTSTTFVPVEKGLLTRSVSVSGGYDDPTPTGVRIKSGNGTFRNVSSFVASENTWSGMIILDDGEGLEYGSVDNVDTSTIDDFACGLQFIIAGQSNAEGKIGADGQALPTEYIANSKLYTQNVTTGAYTKEPAPSSDFHIMHGLALLSRYSDRPVCAVNVAIGATGIESWRAGQSSYNTALAELTICDLVNDDSQPSLIWWQGENDEGVLSADEYRVELSGANTNFVSGWGISEHIVIPLKYRAFGQGIYDGTLAAINDNLDMYHGAFVEDILWGNDGIHITSPDEALTIGSRLSTSLFDLFVEQPATEITQNNISLSISGMPDGTYRTVILDGNYTEVHNGDYAYVNGATTLNTSLYVSDDITGYVLNGTPPTKASLIIDVVESQ